GRIDGSYEQLGEGNEVERGIFVGFQYEDVDKGGGEFDGQGAGRDLSVKGMANEILGYIDERFGRFKVGKGGILLGDSLGGSGGLIRGLCYGGMLSEVGLLSGEDDEGIEMLIEG
ncbi:alpha/beta hydrolase-fold protein, partial [Staphylococcus saprophyticus]|uniref:alpha/beta hydrolase-fold protein n=1 Tax=Staphylococcus saprophyticus TaxID=29385 RepID=UPI0021B370C3